MGAGVDLAIGVVDAAGTGQNVGGRSEKVGPAEKVFEHTFFCMGNSQDPPPARVGDMFAGMLLVECIWGTALHSTSFAFAWLVSGRGHLPGLVLDEIGGRIDDSIGVGITANSVGLKTSLSRESGWNRLLFDFCPRVGLIQCPS